MKEKIYTIPINEAFDEGGECPLCNLHQKLEKDTLDFVLGPSYMEEDMREKTNKTGFCKQHYDKMFKAQNRLGVALMVSTHLKKINNDLEKVLEREMKREKKKSPFKKTEDEPFLYNYTKSLSASCYVCERVEGHMKNYVDTIFYLWKKEEEFRKKVASGKGFCIEHFSLLMWEARTRLKEKEFKAFAEVLIPMQKENMARLDEELDWFIRKFDYRFQEEPWKNSKDSLERTILKISSAFMEK